MILLRRASESISDLSCQGRSRLHLLFLVTFGSPCFTGIVRLSYTRRNQRNPNALDEGVSADHSDNTVVHFDIRRHTWREVQQWQP